MTMITDMFQKAFMTQTKIINMDKDLIIKKLTEKVSHLEDIINEYEAQTRIDRVSIFDYYGQEVDSNDTQHANIPKSLSEVIKSIDRGCLRLKKKKIEFTRANIRNIGRQVKEIIENRDGDSRERILKKISDSIDWKAESAFNDSSQLKYWNKGFFTRTKANNLSLNLYHYEEHMKKYPLAGKIKKMDYSSVSPVKEVVEKSDEKFDYGVDLDW